MSYANWRASKKRQAHFLWKDIKEHRTCYLFLAPYAIVFTLFFIAPVLVSIGYSFTYFNVLQPARFIGFQNYAEMFRDGIFGKALVNTIVIVVVLLAVGVVIFNRVQRTFMDTV